MSRAKPMVTIELEEYNELKEDQERYNKLLMIVQHVRESGFNPDDRALWKIVFNASGTKTLLEDIDKIDIKKLTGELAVRARLFAT